MTPNDTLAPEQVSLLEVAEMWRPRNRVLPLQKARRGNGWAANVAVLPLPPSVNGMFPGKGRRFPSKEYKQWREDAQVWWSASPLSRQGAWPLEKGVTVLWTMDLYVFMPTWQGDLDNRFKATIDFVCSRTGLQDNRLTEIHAQRITGPERLRGVVLAVGLA